MSSYRNNGDSVNCQACGVECFAFELETVKLAGTTQAINICESCKGKAAAEDSFKGAADILGDIAKIATSPGSDPEERIRQIKKLIGQNG